MKTLATTFTGGGCFEAGAILAGLTPIWGVEYDAEIAGVYARNYGPHCIVSAVEDVDYSTLQTPWHFHASPSCKKASVANKERGETPEDIAAAEGTARAIRALQSPNFSLENVWGYREFESFRIILRALEESGYAFGFWHLNSADYGGLIPCPRHAISVTNLSAKGIAPDIVRAAATMRPDDQARILAWDVVAHLVRTTQADTAASAIWRHRQGGISEGSVITNGGAGGLLTSTVMSRCELTAATSASIESLLSECLDDPSLKERWFTTSTGIRLITLLKILECLGTTGNTPPTTTPSAAAPDCPLCQYSGVPQTRKRLILLASKTHRPRRPPQTHSQSGPSAQASLFGSEPLQKWEGWYKAIEDLIPTLPESKFAKWQLDRLPELPCSTLVTEQYRESNATSSADRTPQTFEVEQPAPSVMAEHKGKFRAYIVEGSVGGDRPPTVREADEPMFTYTANNGTQRTNATRAFLHGRVVSMTPRALARFQSIPDSYVLPEKNGLACKVIGNGVPSLLARHLCETFLAMERERAA